MREMALAWWSVECAILWALALAPGAAHADPAGKEAAPNSRKTPGPVQLPGLTRGDIGRVADPSTLHGNSIIEGANATKPTGERVVRPIPSASTQANPGETEPPPFHYVPSAPAAPPSPPSSATWQAPTMPWTGTFGPAPSTGSAAPITPVPIDAGTTPDSKVEPPAAPTAPENDVRLGDAGPANAGLPVPEEKAPPAAERSQAALTVAEPNRRDSKRKDRASKSRPAKPEPASEEEQPSTSEDRPVPDTLDLIRAEIKSRLPYFQACADGARRRAGLEIHRLQATWFINADGTIKEFRLDEVPDAQLAACLNRAGRRPFPFPPGVDLTIPTPIVFVR